MNERNTPRPSQRWARPRKARRNQSAGRRSRRTWGTIAHNQHGVCAWGGIRLGRGTKRWARIVRNAQGETSWWRIRGSGCSRLLQPNTQRCGDTDSLQSVRHRPHWRRIGSNGYRRISTMLWLAKSVPVLSQRNSAKPYWRAGSSNVPHGYGRPSPNSHRVRAVAGLSRQPHAHPLARQTRRAMPGWAALQGAGQQHGRSLHGVDRQAHCRAGVGAAALSLGVQRDRSCEHGVGAAGVATRRVCGGGEVSKCRLGASLAASAELGGHDAL